MLVILHRDRYFGAALARIASPRGQSADVRLTSDPHELSAMLARWPGGIAVVDEASLPTGALEGMIQDYPGTQFVVIVEQPLPSSLRYLDAGAAAVVEGADALAAIATTIASVDSDLCVITRSVLRLLLRHFQVRAHAGENEERLARLSPREHEIIEHLASGSDPATIAEALHVSVHTVRSHLKQIFRKLDVHSSVEAVVVAVSAGIAPGAAGPRHAAHHL